MRFLHDLTYVFRFVEKKRSVFHPQHFGKFNTFAMLGGVLESFS